ncbi:MAG: hypothetical protein BGWL_c0030 [Candidatus Phytoplasma cynodontis]|uniref:hypothetical protein n=1 Tax='Cynodon dactylon' phytoplasma TaxID=295320 RepID=UPI001265D030|nr:hypothetical protein ['Cynodon dactylon' phytoplasma]KAB8122088.1 hypothetical protein F1741_00920 ['Cynodon dactylon' phytoplasma]WIA07495.1 MAG: hypothetical protein BGWL_c0030 [Candidatus Phytoplasma cynodontis]
MKKEKKDDLLEKDIVLFSKLNKKGKFCFLFLLIITIFVFFVDIFLSIMEKNYDNFFSSVILKYVLFYFTNETILFVLIILFSFFVKIKNKEKYSIFIFSCAVDVIITFLVYNLFLHPFWNQKKSDFLNFYYKLKDNYNDFFILSNWRSKIPIISIFQHFIIPLFYFILFYFFIPFSFKKMKNIFYTFIHPILYLLFFFICLFFIPEGCNQISCFFPYPSIQCAYHGTFLNEILFYSFHKGDKIVVFLRILVLFCFFSIFFVFLFNKKNSYNKSFFKKYKKNKNKIF